ncbi:hypothetical protein C8Q76DRAFT_861055 [Earliella scabrosa]|nr:hypothetical protein C8Q76DRAFT_861055 [Earliella scabrosa]
MSTLSPLYCAATTPNCDTPHNSLSPQYLQVPYYGLREFANECLRQHGSHPWECQWERVRGRLVTNSRALINQIPNELLVEIIHFVRDTNVEDWTKTVAVCRRWYYLATTTPSLWTRAIVQGKLNFLCTCLARSKAIPFRLRINKVPDVGATLDVMAPHCQRLQALSIGDIKGCDMVTCALLKVGLPALRELKVAWPAGIRTAQEFRLHLHPASLPALQVLSLSAVGLRLSSSLSNLRTLLILNKAVNDPEFTASAFASFLQGMPQLEVLVVRKAAFSESFDNNPRKHDVPELVQHIPKVVLPKLRTLVLSGLAHTVRRTLHFLDVPPEADVRVERDPPIGLRYANFGIYTGLRPLLPADTSTLPILTKVTRVTVALLHDKHVLLGRGPDAPAQEAPLAGPSPRISNSSSGQAPQGNGTLLLSAFLTRPDVMYTEMWQDVPAMPPGLTDLVAVFGSSSVEELTVNIDADKVSTVDWRTTLAAFPHLRSLRVVVVPHIAPKAKDENEESSARLKPNARGRVVPTPDSSTRCAIIDALDPARARPQGSDSIAVGRVDKTGGAPVLCPELKALRIESSAAHAHDGIVKQVAECLANRQLHRAAKVDVLALVPMQLSMCPENEVKARRVRFEKVVRPMVGRLVYGEPKHAT